MGLELERRQGGGREASTIDARPHRDRELRCPERRLTHIAPHALVRRASQPVGVVEGRTHRQPFGGHLVAVAICPSVQVRLEGTQTRWRRRHQARLGAVDPRHLHAVLPAATLAASALAAAALAAAATLDAATLAALAATALAAAARWLHIVEGRREAAHFCHRYLEHRQSK